MPGRWMKGFFPSTVLMIVLLTGCQTSGPRVRAIDSGAVDPFASTNRVVAFVFVSAECPISNRYAPEVKRLEEKFRGRGIAFWLVYPNAGEPDAQVSQHAKEFGYTAPVLRDAWLDLARLAQVKVTPEAAIFRGRRELLYRGRIDDRYVDFGKMRPEPTTRDFEDALEAVAVGRAARPPGGRAVGCPIQGMP